MFRVDKKLSPELYGAIVDEAHQHSLRVIAHVYYLEDAKGLLRAGVDAFAPNVRNMEIDEELIALFKEHPNVVMVPNLTNPSTPREVEWLAGSIPAQQLQTLWAGADDPEAQAEKFALHARNLAQVDAAGVRIVLGRMAKSHGAPTSKWRTWSEPA